MPAANSASSSLNVQFMSLVTACFIRGECGSSEGCRRADVQRLRFGERVEEHLCWLLRTTFLLLSAPRCSVMNVSIEVYSNGIQILQLNTFVNLWSGFETGDLSPDDSWDRASRGRATENE